MDPLNDCPICFEEFVPASRHQKYEVSCCNQVLCASCHECLRCCPFCRNVWHEEEEEENAHPWLRRTFANPIVAFSGWILANEVLAMPVVQGAARSAAAATAGIVAEASPALLAGAAAGGVALAAGAAIVIASKHSEEQALRLQNTIRGRSTQSRVLVPWKQAARALWEAVQWHLLPQWEGMPLVYHGSIWRSKARERHLTTIRGLRGQEEADSSSASSDRQPLLWTDLTLLYALWLEYNPHTANWGTCDSYGLPPTHLAWHNRWREDLRHAASALARRHFASEARAPEDCGNERERACALCLLGALDHILSWDVKTPNFGRSDVLPSFVYAGFCGRLHERFAAAWGAAQAPPGADIELEGFDSHVSSMAEREVPDGFRSIW